MEYDESIKDIQNRISSLKNELSELHTRLDSNDIINTNLVRDRAVLNSELNELKSEQRAFLRKHSSKESDGNYSKQIKRINEHFASKKRCQEKQNKAYRRLMIDQKRICRRIDEVEAELCIQKRKLKKALLKQGNYETALFATIP